MSTPPPPDGFQARLAALLALYLNAEQDILGGIAGILRATQPVMLDQVAALLKMRALTRRTIRKLTTGDRALIPPLAQAAITGGQQSGAREIARHGKALTPTGGGPTIPGRGLTLPEEPFNFAVPHGVRAARALYDDLNSSLDDVKRRITRLPDDVYKVISPAAAAGQAIGRGYTPAQAQAYAWREYVRRGITGFTDKSGRNWSLSAYVEMSVRTATMRAYNASHLQVIQATDSNLVVVSDDGHPCPLCFPWQNRVLCIVPDGVHPAIAEAIDAGLMHPNCKHVWSIYIEGVTKLPPPREWSEQDALDYKNTQKQRRLELEVRKAKQQLEYATDAATQAAARADIRAGQARIRAFIDETGFKRQSRREQVDLSNSRTKLPAQSGPPATDEQKALVSSR